MPLAALLILSPTGPVPDCHLGREAQAWFLKQIEAIDPDLSRALHDPSEVKPYTVSDLFTLPGTGGPDAVRYALRLTAFCEPLEDLVAHYLLVRPMPQVILWYRAFTIEQVIIDPTLHPWTGCASYGNLIQAASVPDGALVLDFLTPTSFRSDGMDIPLPVPHLLFRGCWQKWNVFAPPAMQMDEGLLAFIKDCLWVDSLLDLNTTRLTFAGGKRGGATGFTGRVGLRLVHADNAAWGADWSRYVQMVGTLARFACYSGIGHHTTIGLGQTYSQLSNDTP